MHKLNGLGGIAFAALQVKPKVVPQWQSEE
jgi:hypothetical protein